MKQKKQLLLLLSHIRDMLKIAIPPFWTYFFPLFINLYALFATEIWLLNVSKADITATNLYFFLFSSLNFSAMNDNVLRYQDKIYWHLTSMLTMSAPWAWTTSYRFCCIKRYKAKKYRNVSFIRNGSTWMLQPIFFIISSIPGKSLNKNEFLFANPG